MYKILRKTIYFTINIHNIYNKEMLNYIINNLNKFDNFLTTIEIYEVSLY